MKAITISQTNTSISHCVFHLEHTENVEEKLKEIISLYRYEKSLSEFEETKDL